jgi:hypothetical protein
MHGFKDSMRLQPKNHKPGKCDAEKIATPINFSGLSGRRRLSHPHFE